MAGRSDTSESSLLKYNAGTGCLSSRVREGRVGVSNARQLVEELCAARGAAESPTRRVHPGVTGNVRLFFAAQVTKRNNRASPGNRRPICIRLTNKNSFHVFPI